MGIVRVRVAGDTVGEFGLCERCSARDIAAGPAAVAIATDEDVRVLALEDGAGTNRSGGDGGDDENVGDASLATEEETFVGTGFGPAVAVGYDDDGDLLVADPDGRVACQAADSSEWTTLADETVAPVRAIDGDLVGTADGVYRVQDGGLNHAGLTDVRDVSAAGVPLAATTDGLYKLGNGWMAVLEGVRHRRSRSPLGARTACPRARGHGRDDLRVRARRRRVARIRSIDRFRDRL